MVPVYFEPHHVTPLAGVWIEICLNSSVVQADAVTPLAGVWIEIPLVLREEITNPVTPLAGVWIEMVCSVEL